MDDVYPALGVSQDLSLTVQGAPTFQIAVTPASASLNAGQSASNISVSITPQSGFTGSVNLELRFPAISLDLHLQSGDYQRERNFHTSHNADFHDGSQQRGDTPRASWTEVFCFCCGATAWGIVSAGVGRVRKEKAEENKEGCYLRTSSASNPDGNDARLRRFWRLFERSTSSAAARYPFRNVYDRCVRDVEQCHPEH